MLEVTKEAYNKVDTNNLKALAIIKSVIFLMNNGGCVDDFDLVSTLEVVEDYLKDTNNIFADCH